MHGKSPPKMNSNTSIASWYNCCLDYNVKSVKKMIELEIFEIIPESDPIT